MVRSKKFFRRVREVNEKTRKKNLRYSILDGAASAFSSSIGETYISPFAIMLNASNTQLAILSSMPRLLSSLIQFFTAEVVERFKERKKVILYGVFFQALCWIPLFLLPFFFKDFGVYFIIAFFTLYIILGDFIAPAWNSMMGDIVKEDERGVYFGKRNKAMGSVAAFCVIIAGLVLNTFENINVWMGFLIIFGVAFIGRMTSYEYIKKIKEPLHTLKKKAEFGFQDFLKRLRTTNYGRYVTYHSLFRFAVAISGPFFSAYMLYDLGFSYFHIMLAYSAAAIVSFLTMVYWGEHSHVFGNKKIMTITGWSIVSVPFLWMISSSIWWIIVIQMFSGFIWAGFLLSSTNYHFDAVKPHNRTRAIAYHNIILGVMVFIGSLVGGFIANNATAPAFLVSKYQVVFFVSGVMRMFAAFNYLPVLKEKRKVIEHDTPGLFIKLVAVRPISGIVFEVKQNVQTGAKHIKHSYRKTREQYDKRSKQVRDEFKKHTKRIKKYQRGF